MNVRIVQYNTIFWLGSMHNTKGVDDSIDHLSGHWWYNTDHRGNRIISHRRDLAPKRPFRCSNSYRMVLSDHIWYQKPTEKPTEIPTEIRLVLPSALPWPCTLTAINCYNSDFAFWRLLKLLKPKRPRFRCPPPLSEKHTFIRYTAVCLVLLLRSYDQN